MIVVDARSLKIRHVSPSALAALGYLRGELDGCDISLIGPGYPRELLPPPCGTGMWVEGARDVLTEHRASDGSQYRVRARIQLHRAPPHLDFVIVAGRV
jgi:hypothetical protein